MTYNNLDNIFSWHFFNESFQPFSNLIENDIQDDPSLNEEDDRRYLIYNENIFQDTNIKPFKNSNYNFEERTTRDKTDKRLKNLIENNNGNAPPFLSLNIIIRKMTENDGYNNNLIEKVIKDEKILKFVQYDIQNMNSNKEKSKINFEYQNDNISKQENSIDLKYEGEKEKDNHLKKKRGRRTTKKGGKEHNRYNDDNIIKKIKAILFDYCLNFINKMINKNEEEKIKLLKIAYKYIDQLEKKKNLDLFEMHLKDLFSLEISTKFYTKSKDYNKILINRILEQKIKVEDFDTIIFLFKITFNDWIEIFTYKKSILSLINEYNAENVNYIKIQKEFIGVNHLLNEVLKKEDFKNDCKYYTLFLLYIFNFQRWFYIKRGRILKQKGE